MHTIGIGKLEIAKKFARATSDIGLSMLNARPQKKLSKVITMGKTEQSKQFVTLAEYQRISGLSYATVNHLCKSGQLKTITTESGLRRIDMQSGESCDNLALVKRLDAQARMLEALCTHLGVG